MKILLSELNEIFVMSVRIADRLQTTIQVMEAPQELTFDNPHGVVTVKKGDFIARDIYGRYYPIDRKTFFQTYRLRGYP